MVNRKISYCIKELAMEWEYQLVPQPRNKSALELEEYLNDNGKDGWELCGIDYGCFIFKRAKAVK